MGPVTASVRWVSSGCDGQSDQVGCAHQKIRDEMMDKARCAALVLTATVLFSWRSSTAAAPQESPLSQAYGLAVREVEKSQGAEGYWPTFTTGAPVFHEARPEVNTFLQPIMIDLLQPLTNEAGLKQTLERARDYTRKQLDETGLVRFIPSYDPLRKGPALCHDMTPDADDTSLAWSVAGPADSGSLALALRKLRTFRTSEGLFRTWLADEKDFRCLAPGANPNPPDIGINFHVYLLLTHYDPDSARALCDALIAKAGDSSLWVYYAHAPLIPLLRLGDVRRAGCPTFIPDEFIHPVDDAQAIWVKAISLLEVDLSPGTKARDEAVSLLDTLAQDRFAAIEASPPLLYHNDLTSIHKRDYWSKDFGYAVWIRIYARVMAP
jgi:hypothetical protein